MNQKALDKSIDYISSWLRFKYDREEIPGIAVAIAHKNKVILNEAYGYANLEKKEKLTADHFFRIASHSKTFTATAIMQLQEKGKLRLDDFAVDYVKWLNEHTDKRWLKVTLRQLLSHGAGVIRDGKNADYWQLERPFPNDDELKKEILASKLVIENNTKHKYSNFGYSLLGYVIESVSGMPYNDYVQKNIVDELQLTSTGAEYKSDIGDKLATGYTRRDANKSRLPITHVDTQAMSPATGFYSNASDLCKYFSAHFIGSGQLLDDESKKEMQRVQFHCKTPGKSNDEDYGLGFEIEYLGDRKTIGHGGGFPGHITKSIADPKDELVVIVLTNCLECPASAINKGIYTIFDYFKENVKDQKPKHNLSKLEGRYMNLWGMTDIVVTGDKVIAAYPDSWQPLKHPEELEFQDSKTLKVIKSNSFSSEGELVKFNIENKKVTFVVYAGSTMWREEDWINRQSEKSIVAVI